MENGNLFHALFGCFLRFLLMLRSVGFLGVPIVASVSFFFFVSVWSQGVFPAGTLFVSVGPCPRYMFVRLCFVRGLAVFI